MVLVERKTKHRTLTKHAAPLAVIYVNYPEMLAVRPLPQEPPMCDHAVWKHKHEISVSHGYVDGITPEKCTMLIHFLNTKYRRCPLRPFSGTWSTNFRPQALESLAGALEGRSPGCPDGMGRANPPHVTPGVETKELTLFSGSVQISLGRDFCRNRIGVKTI